MILDQVKNISNYKSLLGDIKPVITFYEECLTEKKDPGQYELDGIRLMVNVDLAAAKSKNEAKLEAHRKYLDIQICLSGSEIIGWKSLDECSAPADSFNQEKDFIFYDDPIDTWIHVPEKHFTIFYPNDAHAPMVGEGTFYKLVFKVLLES